MTQRVLYDASMTKRKAPTKRRKPGRRTRGIPVQVYFSPLEHRELAAIATKRDKSVSALIRAWIRKAAAATRAASPKPKPEDPRQLRLA